MHGPGLSIFSLHLEKIVDFQISDNLASGLEFRLGSQMPFEFRPSIQLPIKILSSIQAFLKFFVQTIWMSDILVLSSDVIWNPHHLTIKHTFTFKTRLVSTAVMKVFKTFTPKRGWWIYQINDKGIFWVTTFFSTEVGPTPQIFWPFFLTGVQTLTIL